MREDLLVQLDGLCGAYWVARIAGELGIVIDQLDAARLAGTTVCEPGVVPEGARSALVPSGSLPSAGLLEAGTSVAGLVAALARLSEHRLSALPLPASGLTGEMLGRVLSLALEREAWVLANVDAGLLLGRADQREYWAALVAGRDPSGRPRPAWRVGHWVRVLARGELGREEVVLLEETYDVLGQGGVSLQPLEVLARALARADGREGGLVVVGSSELGLRDALSELGATVGIWDNGTPLLAQVEGGDTHERT